MDCDETLTRHMRYCATARKQDVRSKMRDLFVGRDYLLSLKKVAEQDEHGLRRDLYMGAWRRAEIHDDPGSADQMLFCAAVLATFGPRGLLF